LRPAQERRAQSRGRARLPREGDERVPGGVDAPGADPARFRRRAAAVRAALHRGARAGPRLGGDAARDCGPGVFRPVRARGGHPAPRFHQRSAAPSCRRRSLGHRRLRAGRGPSGRRSAGARCVRDLPLREHAAGGPHRRRPAQGLPRASGSVLPHLSAGRAAAQRQRRGLQLRHREWRDVHHRLDASTGTPYPRPDSTLLRVLAINDFHGALEPQVWPWSAARPVGGAAALKPWLDSLARGCFCATIRLDAGDEMQGTPVSNFNFGRPAIAALNALGIDAAAIGNHEFDWTVDTLRARMAEAHYRFLAANITDSAGTARPDWAEPFTVIERGGVRVAVIGLALPATPETTSPRNVRGLAFGDGARAVRRVLPQARAAADYVIVRAHVGAFCDGDGAAVPLGPAACHGEIIDLARSLDSGSVDLIVSGHTHSLVNTVVNGIPIVQARSSGAGIALVDFVRVTAAGALRREVRA